MRDRKERRHGIIAVLLGAAINGVTARAPGTRDLLPRFDILSMGRHCRTQSPKKKKISKP